MTDHEQMVADCEAREARLSDWERGFVDSIGTHLGAGRTLTEKQADTLEAIWNRATERG